uniref:Galactose mutarotase n=1 Tax=Timema bartmani TaxID=61472 RepID=A0A7R9EY35_9NEOP|nr:unnamed protein product [Timema bartmani]
MAASDVSLVQDTFGRILGEEVQRFTFSNSDGFSFQVINFGAIITSILVPDARGVGTDVVLGFDTAEGRVANRIKNGKFSIGNQQFNTTKNRGNNTLHGGADGFNFRTWQYHLDGKKVTFSYLSKDGEEGFPGDVLASVTYELAPGNQLSITMKATSTKQTPINIVLTGKHIGDIVPVDNTPFDLRNSTILGEGIKAVSKFDDKGGYDHNFCINSSSDDDLAFVARVEHPTSGIAMEVHADQPGVQFYTGNGLSNATVGKGSTPYSKHGAFCLETQNYPDAVNHVCDHIANYSFFVNLHS